MLQKICGIINMNKIASSWRLPCILISQFLSYDIVEIEHKENNLTFNRNVLQQNFMTNINFVKT